MNEREFAALCAAQRENLVAFARSFTLDRSRAEDLVQDAMVSAVRHRERFVGDERTACAWLFTIVRNKYITAWRGARRRRRHLEHHHVDVIDGCYNGADHSSPPEVAGLHGDVEQALADLDRDGREVVERVDLRGEQYHEVAAAIGVPIGTVMSRLHRARKKLAAAPCLAEFARAEYGLG